MTVYFDKRRGRWVYDFVFDRKRYKRDCLDAAGSPVAARRAAVQIEHAARERAKIAPKLMDGSAVTLAMVARQLKAQWQRGSDRDNTRRYVREILEFFGPETPIAKIDAQRIAEYIDWALVQPARFWIAGATTTPRKNSKAARQPLRDLGRTRSPNTVNHYLVPLRQIVKKAAKLRDPQTQELVLRDPPSVPILPKLKRKPRPVPDAVLSRALELLTPHAARGVFLTLFFGTRQRELFGLKIKHIDFAAGGLRFPADETKSKTDEFIPGGAMAMAFLALLAGEAMVRQTPYLITWRRYPSLPWTPIASPKRAWTDAMKTIKAEFGARWRWHDIRAAYITQIAMTSPSASVVQSMARHADFATTQLYIEVADKMRAAAAESAMERPALRIIGGGKK
jgi:integrase